MQQILDKLEKVGLLQVAQGGYYLARQPSEITLYDILKACEGETFEIICETKPIRDERCAVDYTCGLQPIWHQLREHIDSFLRSVNLDYLIEISKANNQLLQIK